MARPHPRFADTNIPTKHTLGTVKLNALTVDDLNRDFEAVMESAADIRAANPSDTWPDGLTLDQNLIDLAWHQKEFQTRRSFTWVIEDFEGEYLGCLYVYPSIGGETSADVTWWWRTGMSVDRERFRKDLHDWLAGPDWPRMDYHFDGM
jgi:hypothetical protein